MKQFMLLIVCVLCIMPANAQLVIEGRVTGTREEPLIGAYVFVSNTYYKTMTDDSGSFRIADVKPGIYRLTVSFVGYETADEIVELTEDLHIRIRLVESPVMGEAVVVSAVRASQNSPTTFSTLGKEEITVRNKVQDLPLLLNQMPSVVTTSDAGTGVGYTSLRIRGSDITRINVTINGIPLNDPESHAVYWVDIPDFASSVNSIQVQRGVGSSTNGAGAFGASMNLETGTVSSSPYAKLDLYLGSFGTWKTTFQGGTGLMRDRLYVEGRASAIGSDGYIDRASSALGSYFMQGGYHDHNTLVKAIVFGGNEKTYQAWYGVDRSTLASDRTFNWAGAIYRPDGTIGFYDNQTDNYRQQHFQLHFSRMLKPSVNLGLAAHYTRGKGYYEEYMQDQDFSDYALEPLLFGLDSVLLEDRYQYVYSDTVDQTDLIRRRWLDNHYYGMTWSLRKIASRSDLIFGGSYSRYEKARHFGEIIWAEFASQSGIRHLYYDNMAGKSDLNFYFKASFVPVKNLTLHGDLQFRHISYRVKGTEDYGRPVAILEKFLFLNPKIGLSLDTRFGNIYGSYGMAHREPIRDDYLDAAPGEKPEAEVLGDFECGIRKYASRFTYAVDLFLMSYRNQLILTGAINDDGAYIRKNAGRSYRTGLEVTAGYRLAQMLYLEGNMALMRSGTDNKEPDTAGMMRTYRNVDIAFSPRVTGGLQADINPLKNLQISWQLKFVGSQYLDNTGNRDLMLKKYTVQDAGLKYLLAAGNLGSIEISFQISNLLNAKYESNGYVWNNAPFYYPQAGIHFLGGLSVKI